MISKIKLAITVRDLVKLLNYNFKDLDDRKVEKVGGQGLSTNDFTDALKAKLEGIEDTAQVNLIESISIDGANQPIDDNKNVDFHQPKYSMVAKTPSDKNEKEYNLTIDGEPTGLTIEVPKDIFLSKVTLKYATAVDEPYKGAGINDAYLQFDRENDETIYAPIPELQIHAGQDITVDENNVISTVIPIPRKLSELQNDNFTVTDEHYVHTDNNFTDEYINRIDTTISNLDTKVDDNKKETDSAIYNLNTKVDNNKKSTDKAISDLSSVVDNNYTTLDTKIDNNKSETDETVANLTETVSNNYTTLDTKINDNKKTTDKAISDLTTTVNTNKSEIDKTISDLTTTVTDNKKSTDKTISELTETVSNNYTTLDTKIDDNKKSTDKAISDLADSLGGTDKSSVKDVVYNKSTQKITVTFGDKTTKILTLEELLTNCSYNGDTGNFTFTRANGEPVIVNTPKENFLSDVQYDGETKIITFIMTSGSTFEVNVSDLVDVYTVQSTNSVEMNIVKGNKISSDVKLSSISENILSIETDGLCAKHQDISHLAVKSDVNIELSKKVDKETGKSLVSDTNIAQITKNKTNIETLQSDLSTLNDSVSKKAEITYVDTALDKKVDKVTGKSLLDDTEIARLKTLKNYDDTTITGDITALTETVSNNYTTLDTKINDNKKTTDKAISDLTTTVANNKKATDTALDTKADKTTVNTLSSDVTNLTTRVATNEKNITTKQDKLTAGTGIEITEDNVINNTQTSAEWGNIKGDITTQTDLVTALGKKQDTIFDLSTIRTGASKGATAVQPSQLHDGKLTIKANGTEVATFTANQSTDVEANISIPSSTTWGKISGTLTDQTDLKTALDAKQDELTFDATPTANSTNPVASGGIKTALDEKASSTTVDALSADVQQLGVSVTGAEADISDLKIASLQHQIDISNLELQKQDALSSGTGIDISSQKVSVKPATNTVLGGVKPDGTTITVADDGTITAVTSGGDTPENMVTTDTAQTVTGAKTFNPTTGRTTFYAGDSSNYIQIGKDVSTDFPKGVIIFGSTGTGVKGIKTNNSGDTFKISSAGHTIIQSTGQTYITTGVPASSKNGIYLPPNAASYGSVSIWGGATASNSTNGADGQLRVGLEGNGTYYNRKGVFIETTKNRKLWLGQMDYRSSIEAGTSSSLGSQYVQINTNPDTSNNACLTLSKNKLTYYTADGTEHDLLAGGSTGGLADTNLSNITDAGKQVIKDTVGMQPQAFNYGMSQYFQYGDHMDNASWLIADGQWNDGETYSGLYNWAAEQLAGGIADFVAGTENDEIDSEYYFVVDTTNKKFKLPTMNGSENLVSTVAEDMNITSSPFTYTAPANGWLYMSGTADSNVNQYITVYIDKKKTMPIIGRNPLTQASITYLVPVRRNQEVEIQYTATNISRCKFIYAEGNGTLYYYAGNTIQNADLIDIGKITNSLATKLDTSLSNLPTDSKQSITGFAFPSSKCIDLTLNASGSTYTAPADGWVCLDKLTSGGQWVHLTNITGNLSVKSYTAGDYAAAIVPVSKDDEVQIWYTASGTLRGFKFVYAVGSEPTA